MFKLEQELREVKALVDKLTAILGSKKLQMETVKQELNGIKRAYKEARKSEILTDLKQYVVSDHSQGGPVEDVVVAVNALGQLKRMPTRSFGQATRDFTDNSTKKEICSSIVKTDTQHRLYCFTNLGNCYKVDVEAIPEGKWRDVGQPLNKVIKEVLEDEKVVYVLPVEENLPKGNLLFYTAYGMVKKTAWTDLGVVKSAFQVCKLNAGDEIISIEAEKPNCSLMFVTKSGICLNADMSDIPTQGRIAAGVKGIQLTDNDVCILIKQITQDGEIALLTNRGYGKRVIAADIDVMGRYRKGVKIIDFGKTKAGNGDHLIFASYVKEPYTVVMEAEDGYLLSFSTEDIVIENRTQPGRQLFKGKMEIIAGYIYNDSYLSGN